MKGRGRDVTDSTKLRSFDDVSCRRYAILLLCIPVVGWLVLGILFVQRQYHPSPGKKTAPLPGATAIPTGPRKPFDGRDTVDGRAMSCAICYEEEYSDLCRRFRPAMVAQSYKGTLHVLGRPLQLVGLLIVHGEGPQQGERFLRLLVSNESPERLDYCEWIIDRLYVEDGGEPCMRGRSIRFYQTIPPWSPSVLSWDTPLPAGAVDAELHLKIAMFASTGRTLVYDDLPKSVCRYSPRRLADVYPQAFIDQYLAQHDVRPYPLYVYIEQVCAGIRFSHCPFCGRFNLTTSEDCQCCHTPKEVQRRLRTQLLDSEYLDFLST